MASLTFVAPQTLRNTRKNEAMSNKLVLCFKLIQFASQQFHAHPVINDVMDTKEIENWARAFVADLTIGGEAVPFERVIAAHLPSIASLRAAGLTWSAITAFLARAGGRRTNGKPISADQIRADVSRQLRRGSAPPLRYAIKEPAFPG